MIHTNATNSNNRHAVLVIMGSVRAGRLCPAIASWVAEIGRISTRLSYELADWPLPPDDEPGVPVLGSYSQDHTRAWSRKIASAGGFVFVTPQYNWGYPAVLKNALDHLYKEWAGKPLMIVSYGGHGGGKCAAQLRQVAEGMKMRPVTTMPGITLTRQMIESGSSLDPKRDFQDHVEDIRRAFSELAAQLESPPLQQCQPVGQAEAPNRASMMVSKVWI
jgi:NAD(P)H-dependent FMN reductase